MFKKLIFGITLVLLSIIGLQEAASQTTTIKMWRLRSLARPVSNIDYFLVTDMDDTTRSYKIRADSLKTYLGLSDSFYVSMNMDSLNDGTIYARVLSTSISAGKIILDEVVQDTTSGIYRLLSRAYLVGTRANLDSLWANGEYGLVKRTYITAGRIEIDELDTSGTYGLVNKTDLQGGHLYIGPSAVFATGKNPQLYATVWRQDDAPDDSQALAIYARNLIDGDLWIDTNAGNKPYTWNNTSNQWIQAYTTIDGGNITTGTIDASLAKITNIVADSIKSGTINASVITIDSLDADNITTGTLSAARIAIDSTSTFATGFNPQINNYIFRQTTSPDNNQALAMFGRNLFNGDMWINTTADSGNAIATYDSINAQWVRAYTVISGNYINTGTIDASKATITNINATNITSGKIKSSVIDADSITAGVFTGLTFQTGTGDNRIKIWSNPTNRFVMYNSDGDSMVTIDNNPSSGYLRIGKDTSDYTQLYNGSVVAKTATNSAPHTVFEALKTSVAAGNFYTGWKGATQTFGVNSNGDILTNGTVDGVDVSDLDPAGQTGYLKATAGVVSWTVTPSASNTDSLGHLSWKDYLKSASSDTSFDNSLTFGFSAGAGAPFKVLSNATSTVSNLSAEMWAGKTMPSTGTDGYLKNTSGTLSWGTITSTYADSSGGSLRLGGYNSSYYPKLQSGGSPSTSGAVSISSGGTNSTATPTTNKLMYFDGTSIKGSNITINNASSIITATLSGNASTATSATSATTAGFATYSGYVSSALTAGTGLTSAGTYNGNTARTFTVDLGTGATQAAYGNHAHTGVYQPVFTGVTTTLTVQTDVHENPGTHMLNYNTVNLTIVNGVITNVSSPTNNETTHPW